VISLIEQRARILKHLHHTQKQKLMLEEKHRFAQECLACPGLSAMKKASLLEKPHLLNVGIVLGGNV
jgi:hypothetical protein